MPGGGIPPGYAIGRAAIEGGGMPAGGIPPAKPIPRPAGMPRPGPGASCVAELLSSGGGPSTLMLTIVSPRRMIKPSVRFCCGSGAFTLSSSSSSASFSAPLFPFFPARLNARNS